ncbi:hypothetical protein ERX46_11380 [Brumimicrobium glaciale]|uniref:Uncharacterized protein n=1 Tax=Brumimicrobium glaciale TaxID=200475 RepID=A0A4Q4KJL5_9FLAO|nr:hypothetical protein [Brumimicrobium glaciale]RYM33533.1 hypothetical protein ERX46_11380 [Brumimicrobium glaciale]
MTKEQAHLFFPNPKEEDLEDLWEQRLFEQKQFFLTRPPLRLVWMSRLKKLEKQFEAYLVLIDQENPKENIQNHLESEIIFSDEFVAAFHQFHKQRNVYKSKLLQAQTYDALVNVIDEWLATEFLYAEFWKVEESEHNEIEVIRSKEPDPMDLLKDLKETEKLIDSKRIKDLKENYNILSENVKKEVKRLTLLTKV